MKWKLFGIANISICIYILFTLATNFIRPKFDVHDSGIVVITGTSSGIGRAATVKLASLGYTVLAGVREETDWDMKTVQENLAKNIIPIVIDVTDTDTIDNAVVLAGKMGKVVGVICNAGIDVGSNVPVEYMDPAAEELVFKVNYFGARNTATRFLPLLRASKGRLIITGSIAGTISGPFSQPYSATKHAVRSLSDSLRHELKPLGVSVTRLDPGFVKTNILGYGSDEQSSFQGVSQQKQSVYEKELTRALATMIPMAELASTTDETDAAIVHAMTSPRPQAVYHPGTIGGFPAKLPGFIFKFLEALDPTWVDALMELMAILS